ncbi:unnamed protein product, partial [Urochloa humidicola]
CRLNSRINLCYLKRTIGRITSLRPSSFYHPIAPPASPFFFFRGPHDACERFFLPHDSASSSVVTHRPRRPPPTAAQEGRGASPTDRPQTTLPPPDSLSIVRGSSPSPPSPPRPTPVAVVTAPPPWRPTSPEFSPATASAGLAAFSSPCPSTQVAAAGGMDYGAHRGRRILWARDSARSTSASSPIQFPSSMWCRLFQSVGQRRFLWQPMRIAAAACICLLLSLW